MCWLSGVFSIKHFYLDLDYSRTAVITGQTCLLQPAIHHKMAVDIGTVKSIFYHLYLTALCCAVAQLRKYQLLQR